MVDGFVVERSAAKILFKVSKRGNALKKAAGERCCAKGQATIVEAVLLFGLGFTVLVGITAMFAGINSSISGPLQEQQLESIADAVASRAVQLAALNQSGSFFVIKIPMKTMGDEYTIYGSPEAGDIFVFTAKGKLVARPSPVKIRGLANSAARAVTLTITNGEIDIREYALY